MVKAGNQTAVRILTFLVTDSRSGTLTTCPTQVVLSTSTWLGRKTPLADLAYHQRQRDRKIDI